MLDGLIKSQAVGNWAVLMAGGLGTRLWPLTNDFPKPLVKVGNKPVLETILNNLIEYGFRIFFFAVNYKSYQIKKYFGDGSSWGVEINYLTEQKKMGTAGALSLLPEKPSKAVLVMNGDILAKVNFQQLLSFHQQSAAMATMCIRDYSLQLPYGVVEIKDGRLIQIDEKPVHAFFVNAGIYVLEPEAIQFISENTFFHMTALFQLLIDNNVQTAVFPVRDYWIDIGCREDLKKANADYAKYFLDTGDSSG